MNLTKVISNENYKLNESVKGICKRIQIKTHTSHTYIQIVREWERT